MCDVKKNHSGRINSNLKIENKNKVNKLYKLTKHIDIHLYYFDIQSNF